MVDKFIRGPRRTVQKLNSIIDKVNALDRIAGDQFIHITKQGDSYKLGLDIARLLAYLPILRSGGGSVIRKAYAAAAAGAGYCKAVVLFANIKKRRLGNSQGLCCGGGGGWINYFLLSGRRRRW